MESIPGGAWLVRACRYVSAGPDAGWYSDLLSLLGLLMLTWPALKLDQIGRRLHRLERPPWAAATSTAGDDEAFWTELRAKVAGQLRNMRDSWTPTSRLLLWAGFIISLIGAAMKVIRC